MLSPRSNVDHVDQSHPIVNLLTALSTVLVKHAVLTSCGWASINCTRQRIFNNQPVVESYAGHTKHPEIIEFKVDYFVRWKQLKATSPPCCWERRAPTEMCFTWERFEALKSSWCQCTDVYECESAIKVYFMAVIWHGERCVRACVRACVFRQRCRDRVEVDIHAPLALMVQLRVCECMAVTLFYLCSSVCLQRFCVGVLAVLFCPFCSGINIFHKFQGHLLYLLTQTRSQPQLHAWRYHGNLKANTTEIDMHGWRYGDVWCDFAL